MENTTTYIPTLEKPADYEKAVEEGLKTLDKTLFKIEMNQAETARMREETGVIAARIRELFKTF